MEAPKFAPTSKRQAMFLQSTDFLNIFGGAASGGKSHCGLMRFLKYVKDPNFVGYVFRKNGTDIKKEGGLFWAAVKMFQTYDKRVTYTTQPMVIKFPDPIDPKKKGATISFTGLDDQEGMNAIQGINISAAMIDEACQVGEQEFWWLLTRLRTEANMTPNIWLTCNPSPESFVLTQFVHWWLYPRDTIGSVVSSDLFAQNLEDIEIGDQIFVNIYDDSGTHIKEYDTGGHVTFKQNITFFGVAGSVSVNKKVVEDGVRLFVTVPELGSDQRAVLTFKRLNRKTKELETSFEIDMNEDGKEDIGGRPDIEKNGKTLYYLNVDNKVHLAESLDKLYEELPDYKDHPTIEPKTVKFVGATCKDNPTYLLKNPSYESTLQNQPRLKREQLYYGKQIAA